MLLLIIGASMSGGYQALAVPGSPMPVTFPDPNIEAAIRDALNKHEGVIYTSDLESLTRLDSQQRDIVDLTGLEYCTGMQYLDLSDNRISDISPLAGLTSLQSLDVFRNQINDISPLVGLTNLRQLFLSDNSRISDISPLGGLINLQSLHIENCKISDVSPLDGLTNIEELYLVNNNISDISSLVENSELSFGDILDLRRNPLSTSSLNVYVPQLEQRGVKISLTASASSSPIAKTGIMLEFHWWLVVVPVAAALIAVTVLLIKKHRTPQS